MFMVYSSGCSFFIAQGPKPYRMPDGNPPDIRVWVWVWGCYWRHLIRRISASYPGHILSDFGGCTKIYFNQLHTSLVIINDFSYQNNDILMIQMMFKMRIQFNMIIHVVKVSSSNCLSRGNTQSGIYLL